ncbi:MAG: HEAT repeat domain-containing protein [Desulfobacteraceae bacterium]|jgi:HEAT repeat protein|nr:HEAT repeat domain-containing protein [Desulfobacteraceae bacterium]
MAKDNLIRFDSQARLREKALAYLEDVDAFLSDIDRAVPLLLQVLKGSTDDDVKQQIILLLGGFAKRQVAFPLLELMCDAGQSEELRHHAAIQLSVTASFLEAPDALVDSLIGQLNHPDPQHRANATFALGWEGNHRAAVALVEKLFDPSTEVQQAAVNALANLRDDRILDLLLDRLGHGSVDQQRAILFNLWRFYSRREQVLSVYRDYLNHPDPALRLDALILMSTVSETADEVPFYIQRLKDNQERIRELALERLEDLAAEDLAAVADHIRPLLSDSSGKVRQAAVRLLARVSAKFS